MTFPTNTTFGVVTGRFVLAVADDNDADNLPQPVGAGGKVVFTPRISHIRSTADGNKTIIVPKPVTCDLDSQGYLVSPGSASTRSVTLLATNNPAHYPTNWVYDVSVQLTPGATAIQSFELAVIGGAVTDLADVSPTASAPTVSVATAVSLAAEAKAAAVAAAESAASGGGGGTGGTSGASLEGVRDSLIQTFVAGTNVSIVHDDLADRITFSTTATVNDTDANLKARSGHTGTQTADTITDGTNNKVFTAALLTKLNSIASNATANDSDANLKNRANHSGSQAISTVTGLQAALDLKVGTAASVQQAVGGHAIFTGTVPTPAQCAAAGVPNRSVVFVKSS